jgi:hypothetical protein
MASSLADRVAATWPRRPGVTDEELERFERRHAVRVPAAMRDLYRRVDGSSGLCIQELHVRALSHVAPFDPSRYPTLFELADYLVSTFGYAIQLDPSRSDHGAIYAHWYTPRHAPVRIARGLDDLLDAFLGQTLLHLLQPSAITTEFAAE